MSAEQGAWLLSGLSCTSEALRITTALRCCLAGGLLAGLLGATGCAAPQIQITLAGPPNINRGIPFNVLVRTVSLDQFRSEPYATVAQLAAERDESVLHTDIIYTKQGQPFRSSFRLPPPEEGSLGLYFVFTAPIGRWRVLLERPLPRNIQIDLSESSVADVRTSGSLGKSGAALPKAPKLKAPKLKTPEVKAPEVKVPEVKAPEVKAP